MGQGIFTPERLITQVKETVSSLEDYRKGKNISYPVADIFLSAFSVFFMQSASFLAYQEAMERKYGMNNARNLFGITKIPTPEQIRNVLDKYSPSVLYPIFSWCIKELISSGEVKEFKSYFGYLIALDGTGYFSSEEIHCQNCLVKERKKTTRKKDQASKNDQASMDQDQKESLLTYYHSLLTPVLIKPAKEHVIPLVPEFITPQDGDNKQDCENKAAKRWLSCYGQDGFSLEEGVETTLLGDDLYSRQPLIETIISRNMHYILVAKRESHQWLFDYFDTLEVGEGRDQRGRMIETISHTTWRGGTYHLTTTYTFANDLPLKDAAETVRVNMVEVEIIKVEDGSLLYHNSFISDHLITQDNVAEIVQAGRARWKIENEGNNTLKTKGYHFEHNYGHGRENLSSLLVTLILIAFLFHTLLDLGSESYQRVRSLIGSRERFFNDLKTLTIYSCYQNFDHLFLWMVEALTKGRHLPNLSLPPPLQFTST